VSSNSLHTEDLPPLDADLEELLDTLRGIHPALDEIADRFQDLLLDQHTLDTSQTLVAALGGWERRNVVALVGYAIQYLSSPRTNPALKDLSDYQQQVAQGTGQCTALVLSSNAIAQFASDTAAAIDGH